MKIESTANYEITIKVSKYALDINLPRPKFEELHFVTEETTEIYGLDLITFIGGYISSTRYLSYFEFTEDRLIFTYLNFIDGKGLTRVYEYKKISC